MSMAFRLTSSVQTGRGEILVVTKTTWLWFKRPHTSLMPYGAGDFVRDPGVQLLYNTSDPVILQQLHDAVVEMVVAVGLPQYREFLSVNGFHPRPESAHLSQYLTRVI